MVSNCLTIRDDFLGRVLIPLNTGSDVRGENVRKEVRPRSVRSSVSGAIVYRASWLEDQEGPVRVHGPPVGTLDWFRETVETYWLYPQLNILTEDQWGSLTYRLELALISQLVVKPDLQTISFDPGQGKLNLPSWKTAEETRQAVLQFFLNTSNVQCGDFGALWESLLENVSKLGDETLMAVQLKLVSGEGSATYLPHYNTLLLPTYSYLEGIPHEQSHVDMMTQTLAPWLEVEAEGGEGSGAVGEAEVRMHDGLPLVHDWFSETVATYCLDPQLKLLTRGQWGTDNLMVVQRNVQTISYDPDRGEYVGQGELSLPNWETAEQARREVLLFFFQTSDVKHGDFSELWVKLLEELSRPHKGALKSLLGGLSHLQNVQLKLLLPGEEEVNYLPRYHTLLLPHSGFHADEHLRKLSAWLQTATDSTEHLPPPLPPGWLAITDDNDFILFTNQLDGSTTYTARVCWERAELELERRRTEAGAEWGNGGLDGASALPFSRLPRQIIQEAGPSLPPDWEMKVDGNGRRFYINHVLRTTSFHPPPPEPRPTAPPHPAQSQRIAAFQERRLVSTEDDQQWVGYQQEISDQV